MPATILVKYGDVTFTTVSESWTESVPKRVNPAVLAKTHGTRLQEDPPWDARTIDIAVSFYGTDAATPGTTAEDARTAFDEVINAFPQGVNKLYKHSDRYINAVFTGVSDETFPQGTAGLVIVCHISFYCPDPFYYGSETAATVQAKGVRASLTKITDTGTLTNDDLTFTAKEVGPRGNNIRVKMTNAAQAVVTSTTELNATKVFGAVALDADITVTAVATGTTGERIRVKFVNSTEELVEVRAKDIRITYNAGTSTANDLKDALDRSKDARALVTVIVQGSGTGIWATGDAQGFTNLARGQNRDINVSFGTSSANTLKTAIEADPTANSWVSVSVEGSGAGTWESGDESDYENLANGAAETISLTNGGGAQPVFPRLTFKPYQGGLASISVSLSNAAEDTVGADWTFAFTTYTSIPSDGKIVIDFPVGVSLIGVTATSTTMDGTLTAAASGNVLTVTRSTGTAEAAGVQNLVIVGVTNPKAGTWACAIQTTNASDIVLDTYSTSTYFSVTGSPVVISDISLTVSPATASTIDATYTLSFDLSAALAATDVIKIQFPENTTIANVGAGEVTSSQIDGTLAPTVSGNTLIITRSGGTSVASGTDVTLVITGVDNPTSGDYVCHVWVENSGGTITQGIDALRTHYAIGDSRSVTSMSVLPVKNFPGRTFDYQGTLAPNQRLVADFPNFTVENNGTSDLNNWKQDDGTASDVLYLLDDPSTFDLTWVGMARFVEVLARYKIRWI